MAAEGAEVARKGRATENTKEADKMAQLKAMTAAAAADKDRANKDLAAIQRSFAVWLRVPALASEAVGCSPRSGRIASIQWS